MGLLQTCTALNGLNNERGKKRDVENLLAVIGAPYHIMDFYNNALADAADNSVDDGDSDHELTF